MIKLEVRLVEREIVSRLLSLNEGGDSDVGIGFSFSRDCDNRGYLRLCRNSRSGCRDCKDIVYYFLDPLSGFFVLWQEDGLRKQDRLTR